MSTQKATWEAISQASLTVLKGAEDANDVTNAPDVNTYAVVYPAAAAFSDKPTVIKEGQNVGSYKSLYRQPTRVSWCALNLAFLLKHDTTSADGADAKCKLWMWQSNGHAMPLGTVDLIASAAAITKHPKTGEDLDDYWAYVDTIAVDSDETGIIQKTADGGNVPSTIRFDLRGGTWLFADFKCDGSTSGSKRSLDAICLASWVGSL